MLDFLSVFSHNITIIATDDAFNNSIQQINDMPEFFEKAVGWGLSASYKTLGFMALIVLGVSMFKR